MDQNVPFDRAADWLDRNPALDLNTHEMRHGIGLIGLSVWILLRECLGAVRPVSGEERATWGQHVRRSQVQATGWFAESPLDASLPTSHHDAAGSPATRAVTATALQALKVLELRPSYDLRVLQGIEAGGGAAAWPESLDWTNAVLAADDVESTLLSLVHQAEVEGRTGAYSAYHRILDRLEASQDSGTGLFGVTHDNFPWGSIIASDSLIRCFAYVRRPVQRASRIIDQILSLEESDDALARTRGTARGALAAVNLLALLSRQSTYRSADVRSMLLRTHAAITQIQQEDGSFPVNEDLALPLLTVPAAPEAESRWRTLSVLWLRMLTLAAIEQTYPDQDASRHPWKPHDWPGLGYCAAGPTLTEHQRAVLPRWIRPTANPEIPPLASGASPSVSVVVPCYNLGVYLHEAVESVLAQTLHDFEIIIVDDGSTDEYTRLLLSHFDRPRTRVIHQDNRGLAAARNEGIRQSSGQYICCLDPDDRLRPDYFRRACASLEADPTVGLVTGHFEMFDEQEGAFRFNSCEFPGLLVHNQAIEPAIFRREGWERVGGYCTTFSASGVEDWDLWLSLIESGYRAEIIPETIWEYRIRWGQMSTGMYRPETWRRLSLELVRRHLDAYRAHMVEVIASHASRWAELRRWTDEREAASRWWQRQAGNWERLANSREALIQQQRGRIAEMEEQLRALGDSCKGH